MNKDDETVHIVGAGLAGSECAFQLAQKGHSVKLYEMRGTQQTPAHKTTDFAELVCSNSFGSQTDYSAPGQLKWEAEGLNSLILSTAKQHSVPAGMALGVDRALFAQAITKTLEEHPKVALSRQKIEHLHELPRPAVIATGPLTEEGLARSIVDTLAYEHDEEREEPFLYFFDAIAPIIATDSIDFNVAYRADRWGKGNSDYVNCPLDKATYYDFIEAVHAARKIEPKDFETTSFFEACMPIEEIIARGAQTLRHGPMSPKGLPHPVTGEKAYAVLKLRQENKERTAYNMVGFQTRMAYPEQKRIFSMIPGLASADFLKLGSIHRNLYIHSPKKLNQHLASKSDPELYFAGQITGVEGYFESACIGILVAHFIHKKSTNQLSDTSIPPPETAIGALLQAITSPKEVFKPTNINFGLFPLLDDPSLKGRGARERKRDLVNQRAKDFFLKWKIENY